MIKLSENTEMDQSAPITLRSNRALPISNINNVLLRQQKQSVFEFMCISEVVSCTCRYLNMNFELYAAAPFLFNDIDRVRYKKDIKISSQAYYHARLSLTHKLRYHGLGLKYD